MSNTLVDVDDELLVEAANLLGTTTKKATINGALAELVAIARRRAYVEALANGEFPDFGDPEVMAQAWR